jgi:hypothetical protein
MHRRIFAVLLYELTSHSNHVFPSPTSRAFALGSVDVRGAKAEERMTQVDDASAADGQGAFAGAGRFGAVSYWT